jgi:uncharacterized protein YnzC (UPF0291/DUF896 family)
MITKELIARINSLSQKQRQCGLNEEEIAEQTILRRQYLDSIKEQVHEQLDAALVPMKHDPDCGCGCHGGHRH